MTAPLRSLPVLTSQNHSTFIGLHAVVLVLYTSSLSSPGPLASTFLAAKADLDDYSWKVSAQLAICDDPQLAAAAGADELPQVRLHRRLFVVAPPGQPVDGEITSQRLVVEYLAGAFEPLAAHLAHMSRPSPRLLGSVDELHIELTASKRTAVLFVPSHLLPAADATDAEYMASLAATPELRVRRKGFELPAFRTRLTREAPAAAPGI